MRRYTRFLLVSGFLILVSFVGSVAATDLLPHPFSAEQIRDAMPVGLVVIVENTTGGQSARQQWTVTAADADGLTIEYANLDAAGEVSGEPIAQPATWMALRDHASFSSAQARRQEATRETALGKLQGWIYTVKDPKAGTISELFFATDYPGAPVHMTVTRGEERMLLMEQLERRLP